MSDPFVGEIKIWAFPWAPQGWVLCDGAIMQISQNQALNALLAYQFGGDGKTTFALPDLRGRTPIGYGRSPDDGAVYQVGGKVGAETVALSAATVPSHAHGVTANSANGAQPFPSGNNFATVVPALATTTQKFNVYLPNAAGTAVPNPQTLAATAVSTVGSSTPHNNMQPFTVLNFCICTSGLWPPRS